MTIRITTGGRTMANDNVLADKLGTGNCPDCNYRGFVLGPRGGEAINIECGNTACRARFNVVTLSGDVIFAERIEREIDGGSRWPSGPYEPLGNAGWRGTHS